MRAGLLLAALLAPAAAHAGDTQLWTNFIVQGPVGAGTGVTTIVWMEVQPRFGNNISRLGTLIVRPGIGLRFGPDFNLLFGYQLQQNTPANGRDTTEHRTYEQLTLPLYRDPARLILFTRWRLEQRSLETGQDLGWRLRAMVRAQAPLHGPGSVSALAWSESFIGLNTTDWGQRTGLRQVRVFGGGLMPLNNRVNLEAGYMAQFDRTPGNYRTNHVANIALNYRLGN